MLKRSTALRARTSRGIGVPTNLTTACNWYLVAATNGHAGAVRKLTAGMTMVELEQAATAAGVKFTKSSTDEWRVGDRFFYFRDAKVVGVDYAIGPVRLQTRD